MKRTVLTFLALTLSFPAHALDLGFAKQDGGQAGAYLGFGAGARSLGMGRAYTAVADDSSAVYWNPAGLAQVRRNEVTALYAVLFEDTGYGFLSGAVPTQRMGTFSGALVNLTSSNFDKRDINSTPLGTFSDKESSGLLGWGKRFSQGLSLGTAVKVSHHSIDTESGSGFGMDLGTLYQPKDFFSLGFVAQNLFGPKIKLQSDADSFPVTLRGGAAFKMIEKKLLISTDLSKIQNRSAKIHVGAEYSPFESVAFRAGLDETEITTGLGFKIFDTVIDYAFAFQDAASGVPDLGISHRFGFTTRFGETVEERVRKKKDEVKIIPKVDSTKPWEVVQPAPPTADLSPSEAVDQMKQGRDGRQMLASLDEYGDLEEVLKPGEPEPWKEQSEFQSLLVSVEQGLTDGVFPEPKDLTKAQGYLYYYKGEWEQAIAKWQETLQLDLLDQPARKALNRAQKKLDAQVLEKLGAPKEEKPAISEPARTQAVPADNVMVIQITNDAPVATVSGAFVPDTQKAEEEYAQGLDFYSKGQLEQSIAAWKKALEHDPDHEGAKSALRHAQDDKVSY